MKIVLTVLGLAVAPFLWTQLATDEVAPPADTATPPGVRDRSAAGPPPPTAETSEHAAQTREDLRRAHPCPAHPQTAVERHEATRQAISLGEGDRALFGSVNYFLAQAGLPPIPDTARIRVSDLDAFREIVASAQKDVDEAEDVWSDRASAVLMPKRQSMLFNIRNGISQDEHLLSTKNSLRRQHPYEAISHTLYRGKEYVLRVHPSKDEQLAQCGADCTDACKRRAADFDTLVRNLFENR